MAMVQELAAIAFSTAKLFPALVYSLYDRPMPIVLERDVVQVSAIFAVDGTGFEDRVVLAGAA